MRSLGDTVGHYAVNPERREHERQPSEHSEQGCLELGPRQRRSASTAYASSRSRDFNAYAFGAFPLVSTNRAPLSAFISAPGS
jgi:hypothetical protein